MRCKLHILLCAALLAAGSIYAQQRPVEPRIAGLGDNAEYMSLLNKDAQLQIREDSVVKAVEVVRQRLRENPAARREITQEILQLENSIFDIRSLRGQVVDRINGIEQQWVLANLNRPTQASQPAADNTPPDTTPDSLKVRNLVDNLYFRRQLSDGDYTALRKAQRAEKQAADYADRYFANHRTIAALAENYAAAKAENEAIDIFGRYTTLEGLNRVLADSLAAAWNSIFDNKSYAYGFLMDKLGQDELLTREEERLSQAAQQLAALRGETASDAVADYFLRKRVMVDYETAVAGQLGLQAAADSLRGVAERLKGIDFRLPKAEIAERTFIQYDSVSFTKTTRYSYQHPIPECRVYARGTIYRILLGTFNTKRAADLFKGAYPLCYQINEEGKWMYFAGGFATKDEAVLAQEQLKARGFSRPEIVVWNDGVYRNITRDPEAQSAAYRVEIAGTDVLSEQAKHIIAETASGHELSRVGQQLFVVGTFDDKAVADRLAAALTQADAALEIKVAEVAR